MDSVFEVSSFKDFAKEAYEFFMNHESEVIYILEDSRMCGVVSIGDLERYYSNGNCEIKINKEFTFLDKVDYVKAEKYFEKLHTINEIPVISSNGRLEGIIKKEKDPNLRRRQRSSLINVKMGGVDEKTWYRNELQRFIANTKASVYVYSIDDERIKNYIKDDWGIWQNRIKKEKAGGVFNVLSEKEWQKFWGEQYENGIVDKMKTELGKITLVGEKGQYVIENIESEFYNFYGGCRKTNDFLSNYHKRVILYGPCVVAGGYCKDAQTIASYLQRKLNDYQCNLWGVFNRGLCSLSNCLNRAFMEKLSEQDIVIIIWTKDYMEEQKILQLGGTVKDFTDVYTSTENLIDNLIDHCFHCNYRINQKIADKMFSDLLDAGALDQPKVSAEPIAIQDYYISYDMYTYLMQYFDRYNLQKASDGEKTGAIVMNCNPFTKGHRYLVEQALQKVDTLYLFIVEEDKSFFKFKDRLKMAELGVSDLTNIKIIPSGKYILSKDTFAQYFKKEQVKEIESMDYDIQIFGDMVAKYLGIHYRFVGEEPFDKVTREYNETMKRILPDFGVEVVEVPRKQLSAGGRVISATDVRVALKKGNVEMLRALCPESTLQYLKEHNFGI